MATRDELEKDAKKAGVEQPEILPTAADVKQATDLETGEQHSYFYPEHGISVVASDRDEADNLLKQQLKEQDNA